MDNKQKGKEAELKFKGWMDKNNIPYWYISQDIKTFSPSFQKIFGTKRPDFMILLPNFGFILIDVKHREIAKKRNKFFIDAKETEKYMNLQRWFNLHCWYVLSSEKYHYQTWFWIPITKIMKSGFMFEPKNKKDKRCYSVPVSEFIQVSDNDSLERVFKEFFNFL